MNDLKLLELIRYMMGMQVRHVFSQDQTDPKIQYTVSGFTKRDYDKYYKEDLIKMAFSFDVASAKDGLQPVSIMRVENPHAVGGELEITDVYEKCKTLGDVL